MLTPASRGDYLHISYTHTPHPHPPNQQPAYLGLIKQREEFAKETGLIQILVGIELVEVYVS